MLANALVEENKMASEFIAECLKMLMAEGDVASIRYIIEAKRDESRSLPLYLLARSCRRLGYENLWRRGVDIALGLDHLTQQEVFERGLAKLTLGDWSGWTDFEARHFEPQQRSKWASHFRWTCRAWDGVEDLASKSILIYLEQGFGDGIQMLRFVPAIAERSRRTIVAVRPALASFVRSNLDEKIELVLRDTVPSLSFDRYIWSMTLPSLWPELPTFQPLVAPQPATGRTYRNEHLKIGVCWAGDPEHPGDAVRSMPIQALAPILLRSRTRSHSLYVGPQVAEAEAYRELVKPEPSFQTFADTANYIAGLDCVVTVDTAVAHLAGSLGVSTFLLLNCAGEFRWGLDDTTPWYPSIRIIRQRMRGNWREPVERVMGDLDKLWPIN